MKHRHNKSSEKSIEKSAVLPTISGEEYEAAKAAIEKDDLEAVLRLLDERKILPNILDKLGGMSLLMVAAEFGTSKIAQELIRRGADVDYQDSDDWTVLMIAAKEGHYDIITELLENGAKIDFRDMGGWTALMWACYKGNGDITKYLLSKEANPNVHDHNHITPLVWASGRGFEDVVTHLLQNRAKVDAGDKYGTIPLIWACRKGHAEVVRKLIKAGANVDATGMFGWTPLVVATRGNYREIVDVILSHRPNVNACDAQGLSPLMTACKEGNIDIVNSFLHANAYVNLGDKNGDTSLIHAAKAGFVPVVEALIKAHADYDHQGGDKKTALYWAVEKNHAEVVKALLRVSPNSESATKDGDTALLKAVRNRKLPIVRMLIDRKSKVSAVDKYGDSALHIATRAQSKAIVELLLRNPRNSQLLYKPNKNGETPFTLDSSHQKPLLPTLFGAAPSSRRVLEKETQLGYDLYSSAIANLLSEPTLKTPICVGLFAKWGSGKSFLIGKLKDDLLTFTQAWAVKPSFQFSWILALAVTLLSIITGTSVLVGSQGDYVIAFLALLATFSICYCLLAVVYCGHLHYDWSISTRLREKLDQVKLIVQVCFAHPPALKYDHVSTLPVRFLFTETPVKISTDYNVSQLMGAILDSLWEAIEGQYGFLPVRLYRVFHPKHVSASIWKWRRICCMIPTVVLILCLFFSATLVLLLYYINEANPILESLKANPALGYILVAILSIIGAWILANIVVPFRILKEVCFSLKTSTRDDIKKEVEMMTSCIFCLDAFKGTRQSRLVVILDALESIYESERLVSFLEGINMHFINMIASSFNVAAPFVVIMTLDPHHHVTSKSKEYLKTIVHLPFYLQNSQLRRVRIAQTTATKYDYRSSTASLVDAVTAVTGPFKSSGLTRSRSKKGVGVLKPADSIISLSGPSGEAPTKVLLTDDYFSDVNPKSMRRIMNIVYIQGRLLKAFNIDFNWHRLTIWVNITEQWPLRASALILFYELNENKYTDDNIPLKTIYDRVAGYVPQDSTLNSRDNDERKLAIFLSFHHNSLTLGDLKVFAPFTINLDPHLRKSIQETISDTNTFGNQVGTAHPVTPNSVQRPTSVSICSNASQMMPNIVSPNNNKARLMELTVDGVITMLKQIDGFDVSMIEKYAKNIRVNNINGRVLANCSPEDLNDLKSVSGFSFGDWLLFKKIISEGRTPFLHLAPSVQVSAAPSATSTSLNIPPQHTTPASITNSTNQLSAPSVEHLVPTRPQSTLEKQVTMEETALASAVLDSPEEDSMSHENSQSGEVGVLYIGGINAYGPRLSPSVSFGDSEQFNSLMNSMQSNVTHQSCNQVNLSHVVDIEPEPDESTPLVSPSKASVTSSGSSGSSGKRRPLERQMMFESQEKDAKETVL